MKHKTLVVYFSYSCGNTKHIAKMVQNALDADIAEIKPVHPYTGTYDEVVEQGHREVDRGFKPEIEPLPVALSDYDTIVVGTPTWWYTMSPAVLSLLTANNWAGKTVIPFMTNGGWPGHVIKDIEKACRDAIFKHEKEIQFDSNGGNRMITPKQELDKWLSELNQ